MRRKVSMLLGAALATATVAHAEIVCAGTPRNRFRSSQVVFVGEVVQSDENTVEQTARLQVIGHWKGRVGHQVTLHFESAGICGHVPLAAGTQLLVYAWRGEGGRLESDVCSALPVATAAREIGVLNAMSRYWLI